MILHGRLFTKHPIEAESSYTYVKKIKTGNMKLKLFTYLKRKLSAHDYREPY